MILETNDQKKLENLFAKENLTSIELQQKELLMNKVRSDLDEFANLVVDYLFIN